MSEDSGYRTFLSLLLYRSENHTMPVVKKEHGSSYGNFVICDRQGEYSENLLKVLRDSFPGDYQFHIFYDIGKLRSFAGKNRTEILLISSEFTEEERSCIAAERKFLLTETRDEPGLPEEMVLFRYQSSDSMIKEMCNPGISRKKKPRIRNEPSIKGIVGIYSPVHRVGKTKFALHLGEQLAEKKPVLYLNMEGYSGEDLYFSDNPGQDLGTLLYYVKQNLDNPGLKISTMTGQIGKMDYIMPMENEYDLRQVKKEEWMELLDILQEECIYEIIILDLGDCLDGLYDILRRCSRVYTHYIEEDASIAKLEQYEHNLKAAGYGEILARTVKKRSGRRRISVEKRADAG